MDPYTATMLAIARGLELWLFILQNSPKDVLEARATEAYEAEKWWRERGRKVAAVFDRDRSVLFSDRDVTVSGTVSGGGQ